VTHGNDSARSGSPGADLWRTAVQIVSTPFRNRTAARRGSRWPLKRPLGRAIKAIAYDLGLSVRTVEVQRAHSLDRLKVRTTAEAVRLLTLASLITQA
jgi:hypothetical protein